jgi:predicted GNAT family acetyltransferase
MTELRTYQTPQAYLDGTLAFLERREIENNLLIGLPNGFADKNAAQPNCHFLTCLRDGVITASSVKTWAKAIIAGTDYTSEELQLIADYYRANDNNMQGVVGQTSITEEFAKIYHSGDVIRKVMITHELTSIKTLTHSSGNFEEATMDDIELLTDWYQAFNDEVHSRPQLTREETKKNLTVRIKERNVFLWRDGGELVSIAATVRKTTNAAILGIVYTPPELRGKGYASTIVGELTQRLLSSGFTKCGLFTESGNPISNSIYRKIGYEPIGGYSDIMFC